MQRVRRCCCTDPIQEEALDVHLFLRADFAVAQKELYLGHVFDFNPVRYSKCKSLRTAFRFGI